MRSKHRVTCGVEIGFGHIAHIHIRQSQAALFDQRLKGGAVNFERCCGLRGGLFVGKDQTFNQATLGLVVFIAASVIFGAQLFFGHFNLVQQVFGAEPCIGDAFAGGQHEVIGVGVVIGLKLFFCRRGHGGVEVTLAEAGPSKATLFGDVVDQRAGIGVGHGDTAQNRTLQQAARSFFADRTLELGLAHAALLKGETIAFAVEVAIDPLERRDSHDLIAQGGIADGEAHFIGFVIQRAVPDDPLQNGAVQTHLLGAGKGQALAGLCFNRADFLLQLAGVLIDRNGLVTHAANAAQIATEIDRAKAAKTQDQKAHQGPNGGFRKAEAFFGHDTVPR